MVVKETPARFSPEADLLQKALSGESSSAESLVEQLASPYPGLKQKMLEALHNDSSNRVWQFLLNCLAAGKWSPNQVLKIYADLTVSQNLDVSIVEAFLEDWSDTEKVSKDQLLKSAGSSEDISLRNAAAYLAGLRGDVDAIPILADMLERGSKRWQLRAIQALSAIPSPESANLLVRKLVSAHDIYHQEARLGLSKLGRMTEAAWIEALEHPDQHIRWHAARGLAEIGNYTGITIIAEALDSDNSTIRWVSSELLAQIGVEAVPQILNLIIQKPFSDECRQAAHHALLSMKTYRAQECLKPLVSALSSSSTRQIAQIIAERMMKDWARLEMYIYGNLQSLDSIP